MPCQYCGGTCGNHHPRCPEAVFEMYCDICGAPIDELEEYEYIDGVTICERCSKTDGELEGIL